MKPRIAIVYDRVNVAHGGAEQVILALQQIYPNAVLFTSIYDSSEAKWAKSFVVKTSFLQKLPFAKKIHRYLAALMPLAFESLDLSSYEVVISITSAEAKGVITRRDQLHLCYLLSPPRYLYHYKHEYLKKNRFLNLFFIKPLAEIALNYLRKWDQIAIFRPDLVVPISEIVAKRIEKYYPKLISGPVVYPPVEGSLVKWADNSSQIEKNSDFFLLVGRLVPYKHIDAAILACQKMGYKLVIVGDGPDEEKLRLLVNTKLISFMKNLLVSDLALLFQNCKAVLSPGLDDFGITALEANLFGKAVIINQLSGASELVGHRKHGLHMKYEEGDSLVRITNNLIDSLLLFEKTKFDSRQLQKNALKYDTSKFASNFKQVLDKAYQAKVEGKL